MTTSCSCSKQDHEAGQPLADVPLLDAKTAEAAAVMESAKNNNEGRLARERKEDLMRLKRIEQIYVCVAIHYCLFLLIKFF